MRIELSTCFIQVIDPDKSLAFYRDALGLDVRNDVANGDSRWITVGSPDQPGVSVVLTNFVAGSADDNEAVAALLAKGALNGIHLQTDDLDAFFAKVRDAGAEIISEPTEQPWGTTDFALRDPSGTMIRVDQPPRR